MKFLKKGFTLIELLVVIAIIGILAALMMTNLAGARERARDARRKADLSGVSTSLRLYYNDVGGFPSSISWGSALANPSTATTIYMNLLPRDPSSTSTSPKDYVYYRPPSNSDTFMIVASLENASDPDITSSQSRCTLYNSTSFTGKNSAKDYVVCQ